MRKLLIAMMFLFALSPLGHADTVVVERTHYWGGADTPIGTFFHILGDVVAFPFNIIGDLF